MSNMIYGPGEASAPALVVYGRKEMERQARTAHKIDTEKWPFPCHVYGDVMPPRPNTKVLSKKKKGLIQYYKQKKLC